MAHVTAEALLRAEELHFEFYRSSGPGGQNVNKVSTAVRLRFNVRNSKVLREEIKERLARLAGSKMTEEGVLVIEAQRYRTQERNRQEAIERLMAMIQRASQRLKPRRATRPAAHQQPHANRFQQFLAGGAGGDGIVNVVGDAPITAHNDADRQGHHFFDLTTQRPIFHITYSYTTTSNPS